MMLSYPVLLGFIWSFLFQALNGQPQTSSQDNKVYAYSYHFIHNGTTNSKDILRSVLGTDPELGFENDGKSIVKTISGPSIRGFFTKGILPAGPVNHGFNSGFRSNFNSNPPIQNIRDIIQSNLQPPPSGITRGILPPISPDIRNEFPGDFNNVNDIGLNYNKQDDFPKIPPPPSLPVFQNQDNFPKIPPVSTIPSLNQNDFPEIPPIPPLNINHQPETSPPHQIFNNNNAVNKIEKFERNTPDGGKIFGQVETFSYNTPPVSSPNSNFQENAQGFRRNENFINGNREITGHRTQSYFRQQFRTVTPNLDSNSLVQNNKIDNHNVLKERKNKEFPNQWWNALHVFGEISNNDNNQVNKNNQGNNQNKESIFGNDHNVPNLERQIDQNINKIKENVNKEISRSFGSRLSNSNNRQNYARNNNVFKPLNGNSELNIQNKNLNSPNNNFNNQNSNFNYNQNNFINQNNYNNRNDNLNNQNLNLKNQNLNLNNQNHNLNNQNNNLNNQNNNINNFSPNLNKRLQPIINIPFNNRVNSNVFSQRENNDRRRINDISLNNIVTNPLQNHGQRLNNQEFNNVVNNNHQNLNNQFNNDDTTRKVLGLINDVSSQLNNNAGRFTNDIGVTWDDVPAKIFSNDWSRRQSFGTGRPFSNGHSGPLNEQTVAKPFDEIKTSIDALIGGRELPVNPVNEGKGENNYRNVGGGGHEKFFNVNKVVEGPNSFSQNQRRGFERNFHMNSNSGYQRNNQWSTNIVRRLDAQSTRDDFSKDFIDVFRDDY